MIDDLRHRSVFDAEQFMHLSIRVVGCGAVGSSVALGLAKLGLTNISLHDFDKVESHNIANQYTYGPHDVDQLKAVALNSRVTQLTGTVLTGLHTLDPYNGERLRDEVVFMCVDKMSVRKQLLERGMYMNPKVRWAFDTRIDAHSGMCYAFEPRELSQYQAYKETLYDDAEVSEERGTCGNVLSIGATAQIASQTTLWLFMQALTGKLTANEVLLQTSPSWQMLARKF